MAATFPLGIQAIRMNFEKAIAIIFDSFATNYAAVIMIWNIPYGNAQLPDLKRRPPC
jgi:hypothetical protein